MAIINDKCKCGVEVIVRTGSDCKNHFRHDGKQVIYADEPTLDGSEYDIFRCRNCHSVISDSCESAKYETGAA